MCLRFKFCTHQRVCVLNFLFLKSNSLYPSVHTVKLFTLFQVLTFWYGSGSGSYLWQTDPIPDPNHALSVSDLQYANKNLCALIFDATHTSFFTDKKPERSHRTLGHFLTTWWWEDSDPDPEGKKTYGSGSGTLAVT